MKRRSSYSSVVLSSCSVHWRKPSRSKISHRLRLQHTPKRTLPARAPQGERLFRANCGRCHNPPESLSPREVRAVVRHMRVRAVLTDEQERLIVKFLAP